MRMLWNILLASGWLFILLFSKAVLAADYDYTIALSYNQHSELHSSTAQNIRSTLLSIAHGKVGIIDLPDNDDEQVNLQKNIDLAISIGSESAKRIISNNPNFPVLFTLIPRQTLSRLLSTAPDKILNTYAIYLDQPASRLLKLPDILLGKSSRIGIVLDSPDNKLVRSMQRNVASGDRLILEYASEYSKPIDAMNQTLSKSDIYIAVYDSNILNSHTAKWLLYMAYKKNKPIIGYSDAYTRAGAVASVFSTPEQIGRQTGEVALEILTKRTHKHFYDPEYFTITVNERIQRLLRLEPKNSREIKSELIKKEHGGYND